jgi:hypothetical protein
LLSWPTRVLYECFYDVLVRGLMSEVGGCILRIATKQWLSQVFDTAMYYSSLHTNWKLGQTILFLHKTSVGDAFVGYGLVRKVWEKSELSEHDRQECERGGWKRAVEFTYVKRFCEPLAIKDTFLSSSKLRGRYFHGLKLESKQIEAILTQAEARD